MLASNLKVQPFFKLHFSFPGFFKPPHFQKLKNKVVTKLAFSMNASFQQRHQVFKSPLLELSKYK